MTPPSHQQPTQELPPLDPNGSVYDWNNRALLCMQQGKWSESLTILRRLIAKLEKGPGEPHAGPGEQPATSDVISRATRSQTSTISGIHMDSERGIAGRTRSQMRGKSSESGQDEIESDFEDEDDDDDDDGEGMGMFLMTVPVNQELRGAQIPSPSSAPFVLFDQAFCTVMSLHDLLQDGPRLTWAFCYFNLALCVHYQESMDVMIGRRPWGQPGPVREAFCYYKKALRTLGPDCRDGRTEDIALLKCAIYNNLGHLFCTLLGPTVQSDGYARARQCFQWIKALVSHQAQEQYRLGVPPQAMNKDWIFFATALQNYIAFEQQEQLQLQDQNTPAPAA